MWETGRKQISWLVRLSHMAPQQTPSISSLLSQLIPEHVVTEPGAHPTLLGSHTPGIKEEHKVAICHNTAFSHSRDLQGISKVKPTVSDSRITSPHSPSSHPYQLLLWIGSRESLWLKKLSTNSESHGTGNIT